MCQNFKENKGEEKHREWKKSMEKKKIFTFASAYAFVQGKRRCRRPKKNRRKSKKKIRSVWMGPKEERLAVTTPHH